MNNTKRVLAALALAVSAITMSGTAHAAPATGGDIPVVSGLPIGGGLLSVGKGGALNPNSLLDVSNPL